jgi:hypothetical protein
MFDCEKVPIHKMIGLCKDMVDIGTKIDEYKNRISALEADLAKLRAGMLEAAEDVRQESVFIRYMCKMDGCIRTSGIDNITASEIEDRIKQIATRLEGLVKREQ